jgi:N-acetylgalactosamine-6-sulfatase
MRMTVYAWMLTFGFMTASCVYPFCKIRASENAAPNVILILVDDLGYSDVGCMGATDIATPNIDRLASEGVRFTDFYANAPVCSPTRAALITGRWQQRSGIEWAIGLTSEEERRVDEQYVRESEPFQFGLAAEEPSLAMILKQKNYGTAAFGKWHLGFRPEFNPVRHGFDEYFGIIGGQADYYRYHYVTGMAQLYEKDQLTTAKGYLTDLINERATAYIRQQEQHPFFMYVPYNAVHYPYQVPDDPTQFYTDANKHEGTRAGYAKMVERIDRGIGEMLAALEENDVLDNTLFIFTSDNGGERFSNNRPLFNHKTTLWEGGIRVPCLIRWPAGLPQGTVVRQPAISMDLTATILTAAGIEPTSLPPLDGIDLLPVLRGDTNPIERTLCWRVQRANRRMKAIRHGDWKYVQDDMVEMLFHLPSDISERRDLYYERPEIVEDLKSRLASWEAEMDREPPPFRIR